MSDAPVPQGFVIEPAASAPRRLTVVQLLPALENGGAERSALEVARALVAAGHRSVVVSAGGRMVPQLEAEGSEHIALDIGSKSWRSLTRIGTLRRTLAENSGCVVCFSCVIVTSHAGRLPTSSAIISPYPILAPLRNVRAVVTSS